MGVVTRYMVGLTSILDRRQDQSDELRLSLLGFSANYPHLRQLPNRTYSVHSPHYRLARHYHGLQYLLSVADGRLSHDRHPPLAIHHASEEDTRSPGKHYIRCQLAGNQRIVFRDYSRCCHFLPRPGPFASRRCIQTMAAGMNRLHRN